MAKQAAKLATIVHKVTDSRPQSRETLRCKKLYFLRTNKKRIWEEGCTKRQNFLFKSLGTEHVYFCSFAAYKMPFF